MKTYCPREKKKTESLTGTETLERAKDGRLMVRSVCGKCGSKKTKFLRQQGRGIIDTIGDPAMDLFIEHGIPWLGKKAVQMGRYYGSEFLRQPKYQKKIANKAKQLSHKGLDYAIDVLSKDVLNKASDRLRPRDMKKGGKIDYSDWYPMELYTDTSDPTNPLYSPVYRGGGIPLPPFPFADWKKAWKVATAPGLFSSTSFSPVEEKSMRNQIDEWKRQYKDYKSNGGTKS